LYLGSFPLPHPDFTLRVRCVLRSNYRPGIGCLLGGIHFDGVQFWVTASCLHNEVASLITRVGMPRVESDQDIWRGIRALCFDERYIPPDCRFVPPKFHVIPMEQNCWLGRFTGGKRRQLQQAMERVNMGQFCRRDLCRINAFVKREVKLLGGGDGNYEEQKPRNIISAPDLVKALLGPYFVALADHLHGVWDRDHAVFFESGATAEDVGGWFTHHYGTCCVSKVAGCPRCNNPNAPPTPTHQVSNSAESARCQTLRERLDGQYTQRSASGDNSDGYSNLCRESNPIPGASPLRDLERRTDLSSRRIVLAGSAANDTGYLQCRDSPSTCERSSAPNRRIDQPEGDRYRNTCCREVVELDYSKFDGTHGEDSIGFARTFFKRFGLNGNIDQIFKLVQMGPKSGGTRNGVKFKRKATWNLSGMPSTTLVNTVVNAAIIHAASLISRLLAADSLSTTEANIRRILEKVTADPSAIGAIDWSKQAPCNIIVRGDDMLGFMDPSVASVLPIVARLAGFSPKIKHGHVVENVRFCSNIFWPVAEGGYIPGPTFKAALKYGAYMIPTILSPDKFKALARGKALGMLQATRHVPLLSALVQHALRHTNGARGNLVTKGRRDAQIKLMKYGTSHAPSAENFLFADRVYGLPAGTTQTITDNVDKAPWGTVLGGPCVDILARRVLILEG